ncbi:MAG TPA: hypothetical protein DEB30_05165 [Candidatus Peribacter riflensis]|uniref:Uncharacterized protein n=1 Tax=Candidatus Peribacter riflensis TaxID=1735162 RepID=A0A0S1SK88_9BACT|nr:MAG: hypothetical protein PeribacterA2_0977 [Candidatus Peribacter riflensis]OGJ78472.1 MAG: hypothetical protein A2398_02410 [Candidatus Peribacteria bacterium RIFOXYB1_FULL_57_12]OGJ80398.1 MAG: hypothetical protein A2412_00670 [Candidatus Peribacteria bacterium RIFOXYC1_FULL_58_8]ALM11439.1 MAG: hypothetical protein PeribacterB2_0979 [Candidatus Peribacter riflensis]ALM12541.1 MAG: hypothetical protein PeribacterC2_0978 [Candidatus Peribacter riflensis]
MHRTYSRAPREQQLLLFPVKRHTPYTWAVERLIEKMRKGFLELPDLEKRLVELGIFEEAEEIDLAWAHTMYAHHQPMPDRDKFLGTLWHPILGALETLNEQGLRALPQVRKNLIQVLKERRGNSGDRMTTTP